MYTLNTKSANTITEAMPYSDGEYIVYRIDNDPYMPTYIAKMSDVTRIVIANNLPVLHNGTVVISQEILNLKPQI